MTRINCGIAPSDLCDQHLIAEYRELPRMVCFANSLHPFIVPNVPFTLGTGHMKSCARYGSYLADRHFLLIQEMRRRGFKPTLPPITREMFPEACRCWPCIQWVYDAAHLVCQRINDRFSTMKRKPTWTNRTKPSWVTL